MSHETELAGTACTFFNCQEHKITLIIKMPIFIHLGCKLTFQFSKMKEEKKSPARLVPNSTK